MPQELLHGSGLLSQEALVDAWLLSEPKMDSKNGLMLCHTFKWTSRSCLAVVQHQLSGSHCVGQKKRTNKGIYTVLSIVHYTTP